MSSWQIELIGNEQTLAFLEEFLSNSPYQFEKDETRTFLPLSETPPDVGKEELYAIASNLVDIINGATKLYNPDCSPVTFNTISRIKEDGTREGIGYFAGSPPRTKYFGFLPEDRTLVEWIRLALSDPEVTRALYLYGSLEPNWKNLYMVLEIIEDDFGGEKRLERSNLIVAKDFKDVKDFKQTAQSYKAIGKEARHASLKGGYEPPSPPMKLAKAHELVCSLLKVWIESKLNQSNK